MKKVNITEAKTQLSAGSMASRAGPLKDDASVVTALLEERRKGR
jgi:hypothetical protein